MIDINITRGSNFYGHKWIEREHCLCKSPFKRFQHLTNIRSTKVERMLSKCWNRLNGPFNIFKNKGKVEWKFKPI